MIFFNYKKIKNILIDNYELFVIILLLITIYNYNKTIEGFEDCGDLKNEHDISCLNDIIKGRNITVLGSGKSIESLKKTNDIVIAANNTITHDIIPSFNKIIWVFGCLSTKQLFDQYSRNTLHRLKKKPNIIVVLMFKNDERHTENFNKFAKYLDKTYPKIILSKYFINEGIGDRISTGYYSIEICLKYDPKNIIIAGMDSINGSNEYEKTIFLKHPSVDKIKNAIHNSVDTKFIKNLNKNDKKKLKPIKECGLYNFLNKNPIL